VRWSHGNDILCNDEHSEAFGCLFLPFAVAMGTFFTWIALRVLDPENIMPAVFGGTLSLMFWGLAFYLLVSPGIYVIDRSRMTIGHTLLFGRFVKVAKGGKIVRLKLRQSWHLGQRMTEIVATLEDGEAVIMKHGVDEYAREQFRKIAGFLDFSVSEDGQEAA